MTETVHISIRCNIRSYTYVAIVSKATGKLKHISAGCRRWGSFEAAQQHYQEGNWANERFGILMVDRPDAYAARSEARGILLNLQNDVNAYAAKLRAKKAKARKRA